MTPRETLQTMSRGMIADLVRFKAHGPKAVAHLRDLEDRGIIGTDEYGSPVVTAHGSRVFRLIADRGLA